MKRTFTKWWAILMLLTTVFLVPLTASAKTIYLNPGPWDDAGAWFSAWVWGSSKADAWYRATKGDVYYEIDVPDDATGMKWVRFSNVATTESWTKVEGQSDGYWNQTGDLKIPTDGMNKFTITDWNDQTTGWSTYTPPTPDPDPDQPVDPEDPDTPVDPEDPDQPVDPEDPDQPVDPEDPDTPVEPATQITITYVNTEGYESVYMHAWGGTAAATSWPGQQLTASGQQINGYDTYTFTFDEGAYASCLFNCGGTNPDACKTGDQTIDASKTYFSEGIWYATEAEIPADVPDVWTVVGAEGLFETQWDFGNTAYDMTEGEAGIFTLVKEGVALEAKDYDYKFIMNRSWSGAQYPAEGNYTLNVAEAATYNVTYTLDTNAGNGTCTIEKVTSPEPEPTPEITVSETEVDFGELTVGEQANEEVTYTYKDTEKPEISLVGNGFSYTDNELSIIITFAPVDAGEYEGTLTVGKAELAKTITLKGTAKAAVEPEPVVTMLPVDQAATKFEGAGLQIIITGYGCAPESAYGCNDEFTIELAEGNTINPTGDRVVGNAAHVYYACNAAPAPDAVNKYTLTHVPTGHCAVITMTGSVCTAVTACGAVDPDPDPDPDPEPDPEPDPDEPEPDPVSNLVIPAFAETTVGQTTTVTATFDVNNVIGLAPQLLDNPSGYFTMGTPVYPDGGVGQASIDITFAPEEAGTFSANLYMPYAGGGLVQQLFSATAVAGAPEPEPATQITITYVNTEGYESVYMHAWGGTAAATSWPGQQLTASGQQINGYDTYTFTFDEGAYANCLFNCGGTNPDACKTGDQTIDASKTYFSEGIWYATEAEIPADVPDVWTVVGAEGLFETQWDFGNTAYDMTEGEAGIFTLVKEGVALEAKDYDYKFIMNRSWSGAQYPAEGNYTLNVAEAATYNVTYTLDTNAGNGTCTIEKVTSPEPEPIVITLGEAPEIGEVTVGQSATVSVDYTVNSEEQPEVNIDNDAFVASIAEANKVEIIFTPTEAKEYTATLTLSIGEAEATLELTATGVAAEEPVVPVSNIVIPAFAETTVGSTTTVTATFVVNNVDGLVPQLLGENKDLFSLAEAVMPDGGEGQASIDITFAPEEAGTFNAILYLAYAGGVAEQAFSATAVAGGGDEPTPEPEMLTLYYVNNQGWEEVAAYAWNDEGEIAGWPGELATKTDLTAKGYDVYSYTFDSSKAVNIIFNNNNNGSKTTDLTIDPSKPYFYIDQWYASLEEIEELVSVEEVAAFAIYATNGTIYADCEFAIYNLIGIDVTAQNGSLNGKYIVKTEKGSKLISVW